MVAVVDVKLADLEIQPVVGPIAGGEVPMPVTWEYAAESSTVRSLQSRGVVAHCQSAGENYWAFLQLFKHQIIYIGHNQSIKPVERLRWPEMEPVCGI